MVNEVSAVQFRQKLGEMLNRVQYGHDSILIHRDGKPVAAVIDVSQFERLLRQKGRFEELRQELIDAYANVPMEEGMAEIDATVAAVRAEMREEIRTK